MSSVNIVKAQTEDAPHVVDLFNHSRAEMLYLPVVHTPIEITNFFTSLVKGGSIWVAKIEDVIVGFIEIKDCHLNHLYVLPKFQKKGIGKLLLDKAKSISPQGLTIMVFEANKGAIKFYEREGFVLQEKNSIEQTTNEEHLPDRKYYWCKNPA